jgi:hypothetical protein
VPEGEAEWEKVVGAGVEAEKAEKAEASDLINDAKTKVKDAMENINLPKMPKVSKPAFMKKKGKKKDGAEKKEGEDEENKEEGADQKADAGEENKEGESDEKKEGGEEAKVEESKEEEGDKKAEEATEEGAAAEKKPSVLDSLKSIKAPKMPKMPKFGKKDTPAEEVMEKAEEEKKDGEEKKDAEEGDDKKAGEEEEKKGGEEEQKDGEEKGDNDEAVSDKKSSIMDSIKGMKAPKMPKMPKFSKAKKDEAVEGTEVTEEEKKLLEGEEKKDEADGGEKEGPANAEEKAKEAEESGPKETKARGPGLLANLRHVASGLPALFGKKETETDVEAGETDELLEKKDGEGVKMEEIKLDIGEEEKKVEADTKSQGSEKRDPEKGEAAAEGGSSLKELPSRLMAGFFALDQQRRNGLLGVGIGLTLLLLIIIIAASVPGGWSNEHRLVEGGRYIETMTGCGPVRGHVEGEDRFLFRSLPYSVPVERFSHSRLPASLEECGDRVEEPSNSSSSCLRRTQEGTVGVEDCLALDVATSSVLYGSPLPVLVYLPGDDDGLRPSTALAYSQGVVWVTVNVRQGVLGFLSHPLLSDQEQPPTSGNYGLGDLVTALRWVKLNIIHFGGDPAQVTVVGHRQGASLALALTAVAEAEGLYSRVWASGGASRLGELGLEQAREQWAGPVAAVCSRGTRDCLVSAEAEALLGQHVEQYWAHDTLPSKGERSLAGWLVADSRLLTRPVAEVWAERPVTVPIVIGGRQADTIFSTI